jgi:hypothetical protein
VGLEAYEEEMAPLHDIEIDSYRKSCCSIDMDDLNGEFVRLSADLAYWNERLTRAIEKHLTAKAERERVEGDLICDPDLVVQLQEELGKKPTVDQIKGKILNTETFTDAKAVEIAAEAEKRRCGGISEAIVKKSEMLVSLGAHLREEMKRDPSLREE